ncbi:Uncharacterized conserved protein, circularly permuted ATPgrasp superfamily [Allopseudospirillum japonicum]|uniref:Uncharacterized conserved protein, circularly permuted ATPgrasp superfamily n=1 Tax=Allopseudospirillum japonicum TaxID=64971 RepID=A0A1H6TSR1_9GAMM|nr:circularly permuted type 2 ATP-grasp protein [Allopseudospirillum japonicum]SEI83113.1 Uncharacterized conserved protein, circularly permuted ATPgrasp superfamily [Allopseudospirillum japonicum]
MNIPWLNASSYAYQGWDELFTAEGDIRPHWRPFLMMQQHLSLAQIEQHKEALAQHLQENGVTYNAYAEESKGARPWQLDPCPLILDGEEWLTLEAGLQQRATLFNALYQDMYGEQRLLQEACIPAELVYRHPGFCRPALSLPQLYPYALFHAAFNLVRGSDRQWWVISERLQAIQGAGYALESRLAMARVYPQLLRHCQVQRLASYFTAMHQGIMAAVEHSDPHVVLLSPGPQNETYFEDAYLASYQGYTLVQGDDLIVRDGYVWLKTLHGLKKIDVIVRRISDAYADPLHLRPDSYIGVAGLLEVVRQRKVLLINPLGSALLESPALYPFLAQACERLLGEPLQLPNAATWWCGDPQALSYVLAHFQQLVIKHISDPRQNVFPALLSKAEQAQLKARIQADPALYVGQQALDRGTLPCWSEQGLQAREGVLRTFVSVGPQGYQVMPGGLTFSARAPGQRIISTQAGAINKDTWVQASPSLPLRPYHSRRALMQHFQNDALRVISSRTAENLFWLGRYSQRAEWVARLMRQIIKSVFEDEANLFAEVETSQLLAPSTLTFLHLLQKFLDLPLFDPNHCQQTDPVEALTQPLLSLAIDTHIYKGLTPMLEAMHRSAFHSRDLWSTESWRVMNELSESVPALSRSQTLIDLAQEIETLLGHLMALNGLIADSMNQDDSWRMLDTGRQLERALCLSHLVQYSLEFNRPEHEVATLSMLLACNDNMMNFRRYYRGELSSEPVLTYLLLNRVNPRSMAAQLEKLQKHLRLVLGTEHQISHAEKRVLAAFTHLQLADIPTLLCTDVHQRRTALVTLMRQVFQALETASNEVSAQCFIHTRKVRNSQWPLETP